MAGVKKPHTKNFPYHNQGVDGLSYIMMQVVIALSVDAFIQVTTFVTIMGPVLSITNSPQSINHIYPGDYGGLFSSPQGLCLWGTMLSGTMTGSVGVYHQTPKAIVQRNVLVGCTMRQVPITLSSASFYTSKHPVTIMGPVLILSI